MCTTQDIPDLWRLDPPHVAQLQAALEATVAHYCDGKPAVDIFITFADHDVQQSAIRITTDDSSGQDIKIAFHGNPQADQTAERHSIHLSVHDVRTTLIPGLATQIRPMMDNTAQAYVSVNGVQHRLPQRGCTPGAHVVRATLRVMAGAQYPRSCIVALSEPRRRDVMLRLDRLALIDFERILEDAVAFYVDGAPEVDDEIDAADVRGRSAVIKVSTSSEHGKYITITLVGNLFGDDHADVTAIEVPYDTVADAMLPAIHTRIVPPMQRTYATYPA